MAIKKKTAGSTSSGGRKTTAKTTVAAAAETGDSEISAGKVTDSSGEEYARTYIRLRTVLDSLEMIALRYTLDQPDHAERIQRAEEVIGMLKPIIDDLQSKVYTTVLAPGECPDGYFNCNGCCIPYPCPY